MIKTACLLLAVFDIFDYTASSAINHAYSFIGQVHMCTRYNVNIELF
jgi:hypothetical protein